MNRFLCCEAAILTCVLISAGGCGKRVSAAAEGDTGPRPPVLQADFDANSFTVDRPQRFQVVTAGEYTAAPELNVTGVVSPDVSRQVPVVSLATGRVVEIDTRLGDVVHKGQLLFKVRSSDVAGAFSNYRQAVKNEELTKVQLDRAKLLYEHGAVPKSALEVTQNAEDDNQVVLETAREQLGLLGVDPDHPSGVVSVFAPVSGVITDQQITDQSGVQALTAPNPFTISDLSRVWIVCDVYENDLSRVHVGQTADLRLNAYPNQTLKARVNNILPIMDPNIRTAKVRLEVENPGMMRFGMFATATFHGNVQERHATVPAAAILHLHDREWVYMPAGNGRFRRAEVHAGNMLPGDLQEIRSGVQPGEPVVASALVLQETMEQQ
ncbi:MAG TPA: efflux RND transporter periplasmic adaptor subunit [Bryobacteraceae bacterium]|nr:efflux RND transporter periplasmic adaptor subunit [Bryobacteraceae bacterium]